MCSRYCALAILLMTVSVGHSNAAPRPSSLKDEAFSRCWKTRRNNIAGEPDNAAIKAEQAKWLPKVNVPGATSEERRTKKRRK